MRHAGTGSGRWWRVATTAVGVLAAMLTVPPTAARAAVPEIPIGPTPFGMTVTSTSLVTEVAAEPLVSVGGWTVDVTMETPAIFQPRGTTKKVAVTVRVFLPADYEPAPAHAPYPVLYLLHGGAGTYTDWWEVNQGNLPATLYDTPFHGITVLVEGGRAGWYNDWYGATAGGFSPQWETFHINQLVPWVDATFNTVGDKTGRAIVGLSMGGYGALYYAAAHKDLFSIVGSFSGGTDLTEDGARFRVTASMLGVGAAIGTTGQDDLDYRVIGLADQRMQAVFGVPETDSAGRQDWPAKSPLRRIADYGQYAKVGIYTGTSVSPLGSEYDLGNWNKEFHEALVAGNVAHRYCHGPGEHSFPYWRNDLKDFLHYAYGNSPSTCTTNLGGLFNNTPWTGANF